MLQIKDLEGVKLVSLNNLADDELVCDTLDHAFTQGSQGWGVRREVGVILALARNLKIALELAATADGAQRKVKGLQLENGRLKKRLAQFEENAS